MKKNVKIIVLILSSNFLNFSSLKANNLVPKIYEIVTLNDGTTIEKFDNDKDGFFELEISKFNLFKKTGVNSVRKYFNPKTKLLYKVEKFRLDKDLKTEILETEFYNESGKVSKKTTYKLIARQEESSIDCVQGAFSGEVLDLEFADQILKSLPDGSRRLKEGFIVDNKCLRKNGVKFLENLNIVYSEGLSCLKELAKSGTGASMNLSQIQSNLAVKGIQIYCSKDNYDWDNGEYKTNAYALTSSAQNEPHLKFPGLALNPDIEGTFYNAENKKKLASTIFHEIFHTNGHRHGIDIEYPETCADCCIGGDEDDVSTKDVSCRICQGNYKGVEDLNYLKDVIQYSRYKIVTREGVGRLLSKLIAENPDSKDIKTAIAYYFSGVFNPAANYYAKKLMKDVGMSQEQKDMLREGSFLEADGAQKFNPLATAIGDTFYALYVESNPEKIIDNLKVSYTKLREATKDVESGKIKLENSDFILDEMKAQFKYILNEIYLNNNYGSKGLEESKQTDNLLTIGPMWSEFFESN